MKNIYDIIVFACRDGIHVKARIEWGTRMGGTFERRYVGPCVGVATLLSDCATLIQQVEGEVRISNDS